MLMISNLACSPKETTRPRTVSGCRKAVFKAIAPIVVVAAFLASLLICGRDARSAPTQISNHVKMTLQVNGDSAEDSHASIRWGHHDYNENEYFERWDVKKGTKDTKEFDISDDLSELEIQTQGGRVTGYSLLIEIDGKEAIVCKFNARPDGSTEFVNKGIVNTTRSSDLNKYGEGNLRINFNSKPNAGPIPSKK